MRIPFKFLFRISLISIIVIGLTAYTPNGEIGQFWFFTAQTNLFLLFLELTLVITNIFELFNVIVTFKYAKWFTFIRLLVTYCISITGLVYCFILAPVAFVTKSELIQNFGYRDILLHIFSPLMAFIDYIIFGTKHHVPVKMGILFLIYPIIYFVSINLRVWLGGSEFGIGSLYPYFFIDPTFLEQGWGMVAFYAAIFFVFFYLLASLFLYINDKLSENQQINL